MLNQESFFKLNNNQPVSMLSTNVSASSQPNLSNNQTSQVIPLFHQKLINLPSTNSNHINLYRSSVFSQKSSLKYSEDVYEIKSSSKLRTMRSVQLKNKGNFETNDKLVEQTIALRYEQILQKLKIRLKSILLQIGIISAEVMKIDQMRKIDQIIVFFQKKIQQQRIQRDVRFKGLLDEKYKQKINFNNNQSNIQILLKRQKVLQTENNNLKLKTKEYTFEIKKLLSQITILQKQNNDIKNNEYHLSKQIAQKDKVIASIQERCLFLQKNMFLVQVQTINQKLNRQISQLTQQNIYLKQELIKYQQTVSLMEIKINHLNQQNKRNNIQNIRWRQRSSDNLIYNDKNNISQSNNPNTPIQSLQKQDLLRFINEVQQNNIGLKDKLNNAQNKISQLQIKNINQKQNIINQWKNLLQNITNQLQNQKKQILQKYKQLQQQNNQFNKYKRKTKVIPNKSSTYTQLEKKPNLVNKYSVNFKTVQSQLEVNQKMSQKSTDSLGKHL